MDAQRGVGFIPLRMGVKTVGSLAIIDGMSRETMEAVGSMVAITVERAGAVDRVPPALHAVIPSCFVVITCNPAKKDFFGVDNPPNQLSSSERQ